MTKYTSKRVFKKKKNIFRIGIRVFFKKLENFIIFK